MQKLSVITCFLFALMTTSVFADDHDHGATEEKEEVVKGPNNGRMLVQGDFALELAIFETGIPPEFRVFTTWQGKAVKPEQVNLNIKLVRLGGVTDDINFNAENDYLRGDMEIYEPHSFEVVIEARYQGKSYNWHYDNFEGRTKIASEMAQAMEIGTEFVAPREFENRLKVYGKVVLAPNAQHHVMARYPGVVTSLNATLGQMVKKGQVLMTIEANDSLQPYQVKAPVSGVVSAQNITAGEIARDDVLLTITDQSKLIAQLNVFPKQVNRVKKGAAVRIKSIDAEVEVDSTIKDKLISLTSEQATQFRALISGDQFMPGQTIIGEIFIEKFDVDMAVKTDGLQAFRDFTVVFAKFGEQYEVRMLELGRRSGDWVEVLSGIEKGIEYVSENSYIIKADIDKSGASHDH